MIGLRSVVARLLAVMAVGIAAPATVHATLDVTGTWSASPPTGLSFVMRQNGTTLNFCGGTASGTVDPASGAFTIEFQLALPGVCRGEWTGTFASDGNSFTGTQSRYDLVHGCLPNQQICQDYCILGASGPVSGTRTGPAVDCCGDGVVQPGEQCDDGNATAGDCCSPSCQFEPGGQTCTSDGNVCTDDRCDGAGSCQHAANSAPCGQQCATGTCAAGTCQTQPDPFGTPCDIDGNACTDDVCDGTGACFPRGFVQCPTCSTCDPAQGCVVGPSPSCGRAAGAALTLVKGASAGGDKVAWSLANGAGNPADFGNPTTATDYTLCLFLVGTGSSTLVDLAAPAGGTCGSRPCWTPVNGGFRYRDAALTPDGVANLQLKASASTKLTLKGKGSGLGLPSTLPAPGLITYSQLWATDASHARCWDADFFSPRISTPQRYQARLP